MKYPDPDLGSTQLKILNHLRKVGGFSVIPDDERALEKLWKKGFVRWNMAGKVKEWQITQAGLTALENRGK